MEVANYWQIDSVVRLVSTNRWLGGSQVLSVQTSWIQTEAMSIWLPQAGTHFQSSRLAEGKVLLLRPLHLMPTSGWTPEAPAPQDIGEG